jgi:hypothetical protein
MDKDNYKTKVIFRFWNVSQDVIALFPDETSYYGDCLSYEHVGQHGIAYFAGIMENSRRATPEEYRYLAEELESLGYNLNIRMRK